MEVNRKKADKGRQNIETGKAERRRNKKKSGKWEQ